MAIVKEYVHPTIGCTIRIHDDDCQCSEEEMAARRRHLDHVLYQILTDPTRPARVAADKARREAEARARAEKEVKRNGEDTDMRPVRG